SFGHDPYTKPNLSAPGVNICSTVPTNNWSCGYSGTSMASPHTAGAVALLWSCNPSLKGNIDATFRLLQNNTDAAPAGICGAPADGQGNYTYGYGYLDVLAAGDATCGNQGGAWKQITLPPGCPDWTRYDGEYYAGTGKVYFLGGRDGTDGMVTYGDIYSYDPKANICADTGTDMPTPISNYTIVQLNDGNADLLCTFGGRDTAGNNTLAVQCFKPVTNAITTKANLPVNFTGFQPGGTAVVNNKAYIFGGFRQTPSPYNINITFEYNPLTDNYSAKGNIALPRSFIDVAVVDNKIYAFGGDIYDGTNQYAQTKTEVFNTLSGTWSDAAVAELPIATAEGTAYGFDSNSIYRFAGKIIIAGGGQFPGETTRTFSYDSATNTYDYAFPNLNVSRRNQAGFFVPGDPGAMWVFGGRSGSDSPPYAPPEIFGLYSIYFPITFK
ncbi:MAG: S8 family serine peptidase, partial [Anaerolineales bacterium]